MPAKCAGEIAVSLENRHNGDGHPGCARAPASSAQRKRRHSGDIPAQLSSARVSSCRVPAGISALPCAPLAKALLPRDSGRTSLISGVSCTTLGPSNSRARFQASISGRTSRTRSSLSAMRSISTAPAVRGDDCCTWPVCAQSSPRLTRPRRPSTRQHVGAVSAGQSRTLARGRRRPSGRGRRPGHGHSRRGASLLRRSLATCHRRPWLPAWSISDRAAR